MWRPHIAAALLALLAGPLDADDAADPVLATFDGGAVHASDVAREARFVRAAEKRYRDAVGMSEEEKTRDWTRRIALRHMAASVAVREGWANDPEVAARARKEARDWLLSRWWETCYGEGMPTIDENALRASLIGQEVVLPDRMRLSHFFRRADTPEAMTAAKNELAALRETLADLETFQARAREGSDGQTAWKGGALGVVRKGTFPEVLWQALWPLAEGALSEPIPGPGGVHLFFVERHLPASARDSEVKVSKARKAQETALRDSCRGRRLEEAASRFPAVDRNGATWVGPARFVSGVDGSGQDLEKARRAWIEDEQLYQLAVAEGAFEEAEIARLWDLEHDLVVGTLMRRRQAAEVEEPDEAALRARLAAEPERYRQRERRAVEVLRAALPLGDGDPLAFFGRVDAAVDEVRAGDRSWSSLAEAVPVATLESWPPLDLLALASRLGPPVFERVKNLMPGEISDPLQDGDAVVVVAVGAREPGRPMTFEEARERLRERELAKRRKAVSAATVETLLAGFHFALTAEGRARTAVDPE